MLQNKVLKNATWIIACKIVQAVLVLIISMMTARYLGPSNYGLINYAASIVAFVVPIMQLGLNNIIVQEIVNSPNKEGEILGTTLTLSFCSALLSILGVGSFVLIVNHGEYETIIVCLLYSLGLVTQAMEMIQYWFQAKLLSKYVALVSLLAYLTISAYKIFLLVSEKSVYWFAVSNALDYLIIAIGLLIIYHKIGGKKLYFSKRRALDMFERSKYYIVSSMMITIFAQTDRIMLKLMVNDAATGYYSAAVSCAAITSFIFSAIIDSARPSLFESKKNNQQAFEKNLMRLYSIIIYFALIQSLGITLFASPIIKILYGESYTPSIPVLRLIVWYTTFSYLGGIRNIWILAEEKQKLLWKINLSGAVTNIILNACLIPIFGVMGAALASLITQIYTNVFIGYIMKEIRYNNVIMVKSLNPKILVDVIYRKILKKEIRRM